MDRNEPQTEQNVDRTDGRDQASVRLLDDVRSELSAANSKPMNIEKESQAIADLFDLGKNHNDYTQNIVSGSERLSADLGRLLGDQQKYNKLLESAADKIPDEPAFNPGIDLADWNKDTGTWNKVTVGSGDSLPAYRIVQPGNTLSEIALDTYHDFAQSAKSRGDNLGFSFQDYMKKVVDMNKIADPDKIYVGQAIRLRAGFLWN